MEIRGYPGSVYSNSSPRLPLAPQGGDFSRLQNLVSENTGADIVSLSRDLIVRDAVNKAGAGQTKLISEIVEPVDRGFRRTQTFEREDGRKFTRVEDITVSDKGSRRSVIQQNVSGNIVRLDETLERQDDGTFRRTQRFTDEAGETQVNIQYGYVSNDPFILSGGTSGGRIATSRDIPRGTQLDLTA